MTRTTYGATKRELFDVGSAFVYSGGPAFAVIQLFFDIPEVSGDQVLDQDCVGMGERLSSVADKFGYNAVILLPAGGGAVLAEVIHFASDSDEGSAGGFVSAVFWELFSLEIICETG